MGWPNEKQERNLRLIAAWRSGKYHSIAALARQFRLSRQRARMIIRRHNGVQKTDTPTSPPPIPEFEYI